MKPEIITDIRYATVKELEELAVQSGFRAYNGRQLFDWIWKKGIKDFHDAANLPKSFRDKLSENYTINRAMPIDSVKSRDGTEKIIFELFDDNIVEGVLIPARGRVTACISSQAGCALGCTFCATGHGGFHRNLSAGEIYDQAWSVNEIAKSKLSNHLSNIVFMGMGEPLLNYEAVEKAINMLTSSSGMNMSPKRITVSTIGIPDGIIKIANSLPKVNLAVSLHTVNDHLRSNLAPINKKYNLNTIKEALKQYHEISGNRISIEYLILEGVNDSRTAALNLAAWCRSFPVKINIIQYNRINAGNFKSSSSVDMFKAVLEEKNMVVTIRNSRGNDIDAACGQLINRIKHE